MTEFLDSNSLIILNNIKSSVIRRRLTAEINLLKNNYNCIHLFFDNELDSIVLKIIDSNINPNYNTLSFIIPENFPFKPPIVLINDDNYMNILKINTFNKFNALKSLTNKCCLCCNTIICDSNWYPALTIKSIITEINDNFKLIEKILLKVSFDKLKLILQDNYKNQNNTQNIEKII